MTTLRDIVFVSVRESLLDGNEVDTREFADRLAWHLKANLGEAGFEIHADGRCVRPGSDPAQIGRPMTPDEQARLLGR